MSRPWMRRRRRQRLLRWAAVLVVAVAGIVGVAAARDLLVARSQLVAGRSGLLPVAGRTDRLLSADGRRSIRSSLQLADHRFAAAERTLRTSKPLRLAAALPGVGHQRAGA